MKVTQGPCSKTSHLYFAIYCFRYAGYVKVAKSLDHFLLNMCTTQNSWSRHNYLHLYNNFLCLLSQHVTMIIYFRLCRIQLRNFFLIKVPQFQLTWSHYLKYVFFDLIIFFSKLAICFFVLDLEQPVNCTYPISSTSSPHLHLLYLLASFNYPQGFLLTLRIKFCKTFVFIPCVLHIPTISFSFGYHINNTSAIQ
jgi:hypothetical protein